MLWAHTFEYRMWLGNVVARSALPLYGDYRNLRQALVPLFFVFEILGAVARIVGRAFGHDSYDPGRCVYFLDPDGIEYEVVSYR